MGIGDLQVDMKAPFRSRGYRKVEFFSGIFHLSVISSAISSRGNLSSRGSYKLIQSR